MAVKIRDLAKELNLPTEDIIEALRRLYVEVENENSGIADKVAALIRIKLGKLEAARPAARPKKKEVKKVKSETVKKVKQKTEEKKEEVKKEEIKKEEKLEETKVVEKPRESAKPTLVSGPGKFKGKFSELEIVEKGKEEKGAPAKARPHKRPVEIVELGKKTEYAAKKIKKGLKPRGEEEKQEIAQPALQRKSMQKVEINLPASVRTLAPRINTKPNLILQYLMGKGAFLNINQDLNEDVVRDVMAHFGYELELPRTAEIIEKELMEDLQAPGKAAVETRAPVVTFMGHVDHGKTSLLDYIRKTMVTKGEKGGITQHIGAYKVETAKGSVTFLDTPGHEAFTAMRARGANATDVVVLVVAADDGVMPQTKEAIDHARAASVPIVVAINKCDLPAANPDRVKKELQTEDLVPEEWGGKTVMVEVSAHTGEGVDHLVEMLMLESEMLELKASPNLRARGVVIESKKTPGQGIVVTLLVQNGTLRAGDIVLCGDNYGKIKAMMNDTGKRVNAARPATPVKVLGLQGLPEAGEEFFAVKDEKKAKILSDLKKSEQRRKRVSVNQSVTLEDLYSRIVEGKMKELKIILKADVQGSIGALEHSLKELATDQIKLSVVHSGVGNINESDVMLARVAGAVIIGFSVKIDPRADDLAKKEKVDVRMYDIIYEAIADVKAALEGLLEPELKEVSQGIAQVREVFTASKAGKAAGCMLTKGIIHRKDRIRLKRGNEVIYEGEINALKRFKDDVKDVNEGLECGISLKGFTDVRKNDIIEAYIIEKIARRLDSKK